MEDLHPAVINTFKATANASSLDIHVALSMMMENLHPAVINTFKATANASSLYIHVALSMMMEKLEQTTKQHKVHSPQSSYHTTILYNIRLFGVE